MRSKTNTTRCRFNLLQLVKALVDKVPLQRTISIGRYGADVRKVLWDDGSASVSASRSHVAVGDTGHAISRLRKICEISELPAESNKVHSHREHHAREKNNRITFELKNQKHDHDRVHV